MRVNQTVLAKVFDVSTKTIQNWVSSGCPFITVGKTKEYETAAVHQWRVDKAIDEASSTVADDDEVKQAVRRQAIAKADSAEADAEMKEIELAKKRGDVVSREQVENLVSDFLGELSQALEVLPLRYPGRLIACTTEMEMRNELRQAVFDMRTGISKINIAIEEKEVLKEQEEVLKEQEEDETGEETTD